MDIKTHYTTISKKGVPKKHDFKKKSKKTDAI